MKKYISLFVFSLFFIHLSAQNKVTLSGYVKDSANGEALNSCNITIDETKVGTQSNAYGFYSLSVEPGIYIVNFSFVGFVTQSIKLDITKNTTLNIELTKVLTSFGTVTVRAKRRDNNVEKVEMSVNNLNIAQIKKIPALLGEVDVVRSIQLLPGVSTVGEGATGFNVRGGSIDQNLILLDEAPVFNSSHLFGFFSIFNPDAVKDVKLIKGGMPATYGGRLSSTLDVRMKEGNNKRTEVNGGIGVIFSRLSIEGPIMPKRLNNKASYILAGRRSYIDVLVKPFTQNNANLKDAIFYFYDFTGKVNYTFNSNNKLFVSGYLGRDAFGVPNAKFDWGNTTATVRWNHLFSKKLFTNFITYYSKYDYSLGFGSDNNSFKWKSNIINFSVKPDFTYYITPNNTLNFGAISTYYIFSPGKATSKDLTSTVEFGLPKKYAMENALFIENEQKVSDKITMRYGIRVSNFNYLGKGSALQLQRDIAGKRAEVLGIKTYEDMQVIKSYVTPEPRFSMNYKMNKLNSFKLSYNRMAQYLHLISNTAASVPLDVWTPSTNNIKPQIADQVAIGYFKNFGKNVDYELSIESYYKEMQNQIDYIDGADLLLNSQLEADLLSGKGRAYGIEIYAKKNVGKLNGWISYTLAKSERKVQGISHNDWYANRFDRRHNLNITGSYDLSKKWSASASFVFGTGTPTNLPNTKYSFQGIQGIPQNASELRNNVRIKPFHRLDLSTTYTHRKTAKWESSWVFGVYNVYKRRNPFSYYSQPDPQNNFATQLIRYSVIGSIVPSVSWNFKF
ncbi:MAG: TonB-dependent receptor [bacterium]|nr:TonB-dependent receptor [bacterium]